MNLLIYLLISLVFFITAIYLYKLMSDSTLKELMIFNKEYIDSSTDKLVATAKNELSDPSVKAINNVNTKLINFDKDFAVLKNITLELKKSLS